MEISFKLFLCYPRCFLYFYLLYVLYCIVYTFTCIIFTQINQIKSNAFSIPVKSVSFKSFDYRRHRACAIAQLVELYTTYTTILRQIERCLGHICPMIHKVLQSSRKWYKSSSDSWHSRHVGGPPDCLVISTWSLYCPVSRRIFGHALMMSWVNGVPDWM